ncbi:MAG: hypothetical protein ABW136_00065, partial [Steroidobacteraceae bacterium]
MSKKAPTRGDHVRSAIAQEAARLMAEHGIHDYLTAKRKAAERFAISDIAMLPKNTEVEEALRAHHRLFNGAKHDRTLSRQREAALEAMDLLKDFQPRLVGPVLTGTASEHDDIQLHAFADTAETVYIAL